MGCTGQMRLESSGEWIGRISSESWSHSLGRVTLFMCVRESLQCCSEPLTHCPIEPRARSAATARPHENHLQKTPHSLRSTSHSTQTTLGSVHSGHVFLFYLYLFCYLFLYFLNIYTKICINFLSGLYIYTYIVYIIYYSYMILYKILYM